MPNKSLETLQNIEINNWSPDIVFSMNEHFKYYILLQNRHFICKIHELLTRNFSNETGAFYLHKIYGKISIIKTTI